MEEEVVPASPELAKLKRSRRKGSLKRKCIIPKICSPAPIPVSLPPGTVEIVESKHFDLKIKKDYSHFYEEDDESEIVAVNIDPLAVVALLEKASKEENVAKKQPSKQFQELVSSKFVPLNELPLNIKEDEDEAGPSVPVKKNYSYTQMDLDTQIIEICDAADILNDFNEWNSPVKTTISPESSKMSSKPKWLKKMRRSAKSLSQKEQKISVPEEKTSTQSILDDFPDNNLEDLDLNKIRTPKIRQLLVNIQRNVESTSLKVNRHGRRKTYPRKRAPIRKLKYDSESDSVAESFDDSLDETENEPGIEIKADIDMNTSYRIIENISQLCDFYSQSVAPKVPTKKSSRSVENELPFYGFTLTPPNISLLCENLESPQTLKLDFKSIREHDFEEAFDERVKILGKEDIFNSYLEGDDDFFVNLQHHPVAENCQKMEREHSILEGTGVEIKASETRYTLAEEKLHHYLKTFEEFGNDFENCEMSVDNIINFKESQTSGECSKAETEFEAPKVIKMVDKINENVRKDINLGDEFTQDFGECIKVAENIRQNMENVFKMPTTVNHAPVIGLGFSTAAGKAFKVSEKSLQRAKKMFEEVENEFKDDVGPKTCSNVMLKNVGFSTASGQSLKISEESLNRAKKMFEEVEKEEKPLGFATASGKAFKIKSESLKYAQNIFAEVEEEFKAERSAPNLNGFSTASGKNCKISEQELTKAKVIFESLEKNNNCDLEEIPTKKIAPEFLGESSKKRSLFQLGAETPETPTKRFKEMCTSTPNMPSLSQEISESTEALLQDDEEFKLLFSRRPRKQIKLLTKFEATEEEEHPSGNWDDSFSEMIDNLEDNPKISDEVNRLRIEAAAKQEVYIKNKPVEFRKQKTGSLFIKKMNHDRTKLKDFVENNVPSPKIAEKKIDVDNFMQFKFNLEDFYSKSLCDENVDGIKIEDFLLIMNKKNEAGVHEIQNAFLSSPGVDPALISPKWVENAFKWILFKLSSYENNFEQYFEKVLCPENVLLQLKYRYDCEIDRAQRTVIKKIVEKDDLPSKRIVLFISNIMGPELELCDGCYSIRTVIDSHLSEFVDRKKIGIGSKLMIQGAELLNLEEGCSPLDIPPDVRLKIYANSTRKAPWDAKLGYFKSDSSLLLSSNSILERGGLISKIQVFVIRVYPMMYVDKTPGETSGSVLRSEKVEQRLVLKYDADRFGSIESLFCQIQKEFEDEENQKKKNKGFVGQKITNLTSMSQLHEIVEYDASDIEADLTTTQKNAFSEYQSKKNQEKLDEINKRVKERLKSSNSTRKVTPLLKLKIVDARKPQKVLMLSIWRPPDDLNTVIQEKHVLDITNSSANGTRGGEIQITAGKNTIIKRLNSSKFTPPTEIFRVVTKISQIDNATFKPRFNEFDTIGLVVYIGSPEFKKFQMVYLADEKGNLLCVNFWSGIKEYAYDDVVKLKSVLCISNLQWRTVNSNILIPNSFATEYTTFRECPKMEHFKSELVSFKAELEALDLDALFDSCVVRILELKDKKSFPTPLGACNTPNRSFMTNNNGQTPKNFSPGIGQPVSLIKRRIEQLQTYGSPPKLSPIVMRTRRSARQNFKSPAKLDNKINENHNDSFR